VIEYEYTRNFWNDEQGQELIEYTLLMAFVALTSALLCLGSPHAPTTSASSHVHDLRPAYTFVGLIAVGLQNAFPLL
jgi:hypothetical protein